jgi:GntR family transcriptional regulator, regulator for abcA and norABC
MTWAPDPTSKTPLYRQIALHLEQQISKGVLPPGSLLPSERKLAKQLNVNRSTVVAAYAELRSTGLIESKQGSGTRVSTELWGISTRRLPDWRAYVEQGMFLPSLPLFNRVREAMAVPGVINLASGEPDPGFFPTLSLSELMAEVPVKAALNYPEPLGLRFLREQISRYMKRLVGIEASADEILITAGAQQGLHLITQCLLSPGDSVALEGPSYFYSLPLFPSAGLRMVRLPLDDEGLNPEAIHSLYQRHKVRMVFSIPTLQNPTGVTLSMDRRRRVLDICRELRIPIVEDDPYHALYPDNGRPLAIKSLDDAHQVLYVGSLSKIVAPGLRIGWIVGPHSVLARLADAKRQMDFGTSTIVQYLAALYLSSNDWEQHLDSIRSKLDQQKHVMARYINASLPELLEFHVPQGGYYMWCRLHRPCDETHFIEACIRNGVVVMPGTFFGAQPGYLRMTYAKSAAATIEEGLRRLNRALTELTP